MPSDIYRYSLVSYTPVGNVVGDITKEKAASILAGSWKSVERAFVDLHKLGSLGCLGCTIIAHPVQVEVKPLK